MEHRTDPGHVSTDGFTEDQSTLSSGLHEIPLPESKDRPFQVFPGPVEVEVVLTVEEKERLPSIVVEPGKERLPSIVVEAADASEVESGELRWPPDLLDLEEDDEDPFPERCTPPGRIADESGDGEQGEEDEEDEDEHSQQDESSVAVGDQQNTSLLDLHLSDYRDDTPSLSPESASALN